MTAELLLHQASCAYCVLPAGGLRTHYPNKLCKSNLPLKRKPGKAFHCQTQKEESSGHLSAEHDNQVLLFKEQGDGCSPAQDHNHDSILKGLHDDNGGHNKASSGLSKYNTECHVEVVSWRERRITASIVVDANPQRVWGVLTDYERLSEFIPNLICSEKIPCPYLGRIWLLQRGLQRMMYWNIEAYVILDLQEFPELETGSELHFSMVDGDFKRYDGKWYLRTGSRPQTTLLYYEVNVVPKIIFPAAFVENIIKTDLPKNLCAIAKRAEAESEFSKIPNKQLSSEPASANCQEEACAIINTNVTDSHWSGFGRSCKLGSQCLADEIHFRRLDDLLENGGVHRQVVASVTVKASSKDVWNVLTAYEVLPEFVPNLASSTVLSREGKRVRLLQEGCKCLLYMVLHARVILDLWEEPEQEISFKQVEGDFNSFQGNWTLNQFGSEHTVLKYSVDTKIWKDYILAESLVEEVIYEDLPSNLCAIRDRVESLANFPGSIPICPPEVSENISLSGSESISICGHSYAMELGKGGSAPKGLEIQEASTLMESPTDPPTKLIKGRARARARARAEGLMDDFRVLEKELRGFISAHGIEGVMPMRKHLRQHGRSDLGKAVRAMGGFQTVAARMKLSLSYKEKKPDGFWDDVRNLRNEVVAAQKELGCDPAVLPSRWSLEKLGHYGLARALEKWGGAKETARILGLKTMGLHKQEHPRKKAYKKYDGPKEHPCKRTYTNYEGTPQETYTKNDGPKELPKSQQAGKNEQLSQEAGRKEKIKPLRAEADKLVSSSSQAKRMPFKTGVPRESSKWLTLFSDASDTDELQDVDE